MKLMSEASAEKLRGGFYTPKPIAKFILRWGINGSKHLKILEPSCGDGVFLEQIKKNNLKYQSITAIELDEIESIKTKNIQLENSQVINADFHSYCNTTSDKFDLIIGNPPYIRYQFFDKYQQIQAAIVSRKSISFWSRK